MAGNIEFDEDKFGLGTGSNAGAYSKYQPVNPYTATAGGSGFANWLLAHHLAKNPQAANKILTVIIVLNFIIAAIIIKLAL